MVYKTTLKHRNDNEPIKQTVTDKNWKTPYFYVIIVTSVTLFIPLFMHLYYLQYHKCTIKAVVSVFQQGGGKKSKMDPNGPVIESADHLNNPMWKEHKV